MALKPSRERPSLPPAASCPHHVLGTPLPRLRLHPRPEEQGGSSQQTPWESQQGIVQPVWSPGTLTAGPGSQCALSTPLGAAHGTAPLS